MKEGKKGGELSLEFGCGFKIPCFYTYFVGALLYGLNRTYTPIVGFSLLCPHYLRLLRLPASHNKHYPALIFHAPNSTHASAPTSQFPDRLEPRVTSLCVEARIGCFGVYVLSRDFRFLSWEDVG
jgi:hypothetical protein